MSEESTPTQVEAPEAPKAEKPKKFRIVVDDNGNEVSREPAGRGRPPQGSYRDDDGNLVVPQSAVSKPQKDAVQYIDCDVDGNEISRSPKGRGRPKPGYTKQPDGNWLKVVSDQTDETVEATEVASEAPVVEVPAEAETADAN